MKYEYNGILVESDTPLDSAVFRPVENELPTTRETETEQKPARVQGKKRTSAGRRK